MLSLVGVLVISFFWIVCVGVMVCFVLLGWVLMVGLCRFLAWLFDSVRVVMVGLDLLCGCCA